MSERKRYAVVGAGPAGLSAAWELAKAGGSVVVYEARAEPGGRMRSEDLDGAVVDVAVQLFGSTYASLFRLAEEAGARGLLVRSPGRDAVWRDGRPHTITYGSVASLVASKALPASLKLRLAMRYLPYLAAHARRLDANDPARTGGAELDDASVAEWGLAELGEDFVELLAYPLLGAYYGGTPERVSVALYHALAKVGTDVRVYGVRGGVGALAAAVLDALRVRGVEWRGGDVVTGIHPAERGIEVHSSSGASVFEGVVLAVPAGVAAALLGRADELGDWLGRVESAPTATLALKLDRRPVADYFGLSFPRVTPVGRTVVAACIEHRKLGGLVPDGVGLVVAYPSPMVAASLSATEPVGATEQVVSALSEVFPGLPERVERAKLYPFPEGYTLFYPGYLRHILRFDERWLPAGLALAGDYLVAPTVEGAVVSGRRAAERLLPSGA